MKRHIGKPEFWGWILFIGCALVFLGIGVRDADGPMILGSLLFLGACVLFFLPYMR